MRTKAFNWSDEELITDKDTEESETKLLKEKYGKKKQTNYQKALIYKQNVQSKLVAKTSNDTKYRRLKDDKNQKAQIQLSKTQTSPTKERDNNQLLKNYNDEDDLEDI